jgi:D-galactose 1-dehydrogenase
MKPDLQPHRIGIIGVGKIARDRHIPSIAADPAFDLIALANVAGVPPEGTPRVFASYLEMLERVPELQAVAICTPPGVRHSIARAALLAGKHVLLEKPPAATPEEVLDLRQLAQQCGCVLFAAYHSHFNAAVDEAKRQLSGRTVTHLTVEWKEDVHKWHPGQDWIWRHGGFGVFDSGINALSILTKILPRPVFIHDAVLLFPDDSEAPIAATLRLGSNNSSSDWRVVLDWRPIAAEIREIAIASDDGTHLKLSASGGRLEIDGVTVVAHERAEYAGIYRHFDILLCNGTSDVDATPLQLVADSFLLGRRTDHRPAQQMSGDN